MIDTVLEVLGRAVWGEGSDKGEVGRGPRGTWNTFANHNARVRGAFDGFLVF